MGADKFLTLTNINLDHLQLIKNAVNSTQNEKQHPPSQPGEPKNIEQVLPFGEFIGASDGRNRSKTDFSSPPSFLEQNPTYSPDDDHVKTTKITKSKATPKPAESCFDNQNRTPTKKPVQLNKPLPQIPPQQEPPSRAPQKKSGIPTSAPPKPQNFMQPQVQQELSNVLHKRPVDNNSNHSEQTRVQYSQQNEKPVTPTATPSVPAYLSGIATVTTASPQPIGSTPTHGIPQNNTPVQRNPQPQAYVASVGTSQPVVGTATAYQPSYLSGNTTPNVNSQTGSSLGYQQQPSVNLYSQQASVLPDRNARPAATVPLGSPVIPNPVAPQPQFQPQAQSTIVVPDDWEPKQTPDGRIFYLDHTERKTHWAPPPGWGVRKTPGDKRLYYVHHPTKTTHWSLPPAGWDLCKLADGRIFYVDHINKKTSWTLPE